MHHFLISLNHFLIGFGSSEGDLIIKSIIQETMKDSIVCTYELFIQFMFDFFWMVEKIAIDTFLR